MAEEAVLPPGGRPPGDPPKQTLLTVRELRVNFGPVRAVDGVSLTVSRGPFGIGLVGESGSGKTTAGRAILRLVPAAGGEILFEGADNSLDPRMRIGAAIGEVLTAHGRGRGAVPDRVAALLAEVGLDAA